MIKIADQRNQANNLLNKNRAGLMQHAIGHSPISLMRESNVFTRITTAISLAFFLSTFYIVPTAQAVDETIEAEKQKNIFHPQGKTDEEKLSNTLQAIKEHVTEKKTALNKRVAEESSLWQDFLNVFGLSGLLAEDLDKLASMTEQAETLHQKALQGFAEVEQELKTKNLPDTILQRHRDTVEQYKTEYQRFLEKLQQAQAAESLQDQDEALGELDGFFGEQQFKRSQQPFDPEKLPFGTPDPSKTRKPADNAQQLNDLLGLNYQPGAIENLINGVIPPAYAQSGNEPTAADLEPTIDVQITAAIQAKADELNHNPVQIYNWVRNNIEFLPTYGSIQGSDMTLQSQRGNPFDTASLLIALLRASDIPARYAYGTVQIPVEQVMNWVGGVEVPEAALSILGQGGIPAIGQIQGGRISHIKMEHIWVEAWVDFEPSRAAKNIQGDSWIPLDASFKQYDYTNGIDIQSQVPFDAQTFADTIINNATIDETTGTVQNIDQQYIEDQLTQYQQQVEDFIANQNPDATVGEVIGSKTIRVFNPPQLAAGLPYKQLATSTRFAGLPDNLRHKYRFQLQSEYGSTLFSQTLDLPTLAGKTLALSFRPATAADEQTIQSYIPDDITDISQLPNSLPGYLINLEAELVVDQQETLTGVRMNMGSEVTLNQALYSPQNNWQSTNTVIIAGEYHAIGVSGAGVSATQLEKLKSETETVQGILGDCRDNNNCDPVETLNKHQVTGTILQVGVLGWFARTSTQSEILADQQNTIMYSLPSYGKFSSSAEVQYSWGIARNVGFPGVMMDIDYSKLSVQSKNGNKQKNISFVIAHGAQASVNEHFIPEQIFSGSGSTSSQGVSAVKAINMAAANGQKVFTLNKNNSNQIYNVTIDNITRNEILNAIDAGKEVTVHEAPVNMSSWFGSGYIIIDPDTGSGAYKISGGQNGGWYLIAAIVFGILAIAFLLTLGIFGILAWGWMLGLMGAMLGNYFEMNPNAELDLDVLVSVRLLGFIIAIFVFGIAAFTVFTWIGLALLAIQAILLMVRRYASNFNTNQIWEMNRSPSSKNISQCWV